MSMRFTEAFEYSTANGGLFGIIARNGIITKSTNAHDWKLVEFRFKPQSPDYEHGDLVKLCYDTTVHCCLRDNADGTLSFIGAAGTVLATSTKVLVLDAWHFIEMRVTIGKLGSYEVRVNGTSMGWIPQAIGNTQNGENAATNVIWMRT